MTTATRPWPADCEPTPEQLADWLLVCGPTDRLEFAGKALANAHEALRCLVENHDEQGRFVSQVIAIAPALKPGDRVLLAGSFEDSWEWGVVNRQLSERFPGVEFTFVEATGLAVQRAST